ncbi:MAG: TIGR03960 family B12-binding radical SAM protein [Clostridiales bacterium]|jgi:radical SAM family uncharacterized protein|nr:TIGR03960 family B12-binding radical SAM protein [Clostridiales bacterium]
MYSDSLLRSVEKPGRYTGGEFGQVIKSKDGVAARVAFCFPDTYEIGMSNLGVRILYGVLNAMDDVWCERVFAPWVDMEAEMRKKGIRLSALESGDELLCFDFVAFTLQYELSYTNVLNMLELAGLPLTSAERGDLVLGTSPIVIGGGPCAYNAEPVADFFDLFLIGEGEEALPELVRLYINMKKSGASKSEFLREAAKLEGWYVPSLYEIEYGDDGTIASVTPLDGAPAKIKKRIVLDLDKSYFPDMVVMPYIETVHDRIMLEVYRGCIRGCRFCQAGMVYRPVREKSPEVLDRQARVLCDNTGYSEISLSSLSISDYSCLRDLTQRLLSWTEERKINLSLPSLRADSFTDELMERISSVRSSGLTFAPEAGTPRLRDAINKNITEEEILSACRTAYAAGKTSVKLYFMIGLPTETYEDIDGIAELAQKAVDEYYRTPERVKGRHVNVTISVAGFVPKPFTPFQWCAQDTVETLREKQAYLADKLKGNRKVRYNWHEAKVSFLEAVFARGDRRLSAALIEARRRGVRFDSWDEFFDYDVWMDIFKTVGIDPSFYANREFGKNEVLPWDIFDIGVTKSFLHREYERAKRSEPSKNCREGCLGCGANRLGGERSCCPIP